MTVRDLWKIGATALVAGPVVLAVAPALPLLLAFWVAGRVLCADAPLLIVRRAGTVMFSRSREWCSRHWVIAGSLAAPILAGILFVPVYYLEKRVHSDEGRTLLHFYFQIITGNWSSPPFKYTKTPVAISLSISFAVVLNLASFGLIAIAIRKIRNLRREHTVRLLDRDAASDSAIKTSIFALLAETGKFSDEELQTLDAKVGAAIKGARAGWLAEELPRIVGPENARLLRDTFREQRFGQQ